MKFPIKALVFLFLLSVLCPVNAQESFWGRRRLLRAILERVIRILREIRGVPSVGPQHPTDIFIPIPEHIHHSDFLPLLRPSTFPIFTRHSMDCWCTSHAGCKCDDTRGYNECLQLSRSDFNMLEQCPTVHNREQRTYSCISDPGVADRYQAIGDATGVGDQSISCPFGSLYCRGARSQLMNCWCIENDDCLCTNAKGQQREFVCASEVDLE